MKGPARFQRVSVVVDLGCEDVHASGCSVMLNDISSETLAETINCIVSFDNFGLNTILK